MTRQEKIWEGMVKFIRTARRYDTPEDEASILLRYLKHQGAVLKVERELPTVQRNPGRDTYGNMRETQQDMLKAGYTATERLIEEGK